MFTLNKKSVTPSYASSVETWYQEQSWLDKKTKMSLSKQSSAFGIGGIVCVCRICSGGLLWRDFFSAGWTRRGGGRQERTGQTVSLARHTCNQANTGRCTCLVDHTPRARVLLTTRRSGGIHCVKETTEEKIRGTCNHDYRRKTGQGLSQIIRQVVTMNFCRLR